MAGWGGMIGIEVEIPWDRYRRTSITLPAPLLVYLRLRATAEGRTMSEIVQRALMMYLGVGPGGGSSGS